MHNNLVNMEHNNQAEAEHDNLAEADQDNQAIVELNFLIKYLKNN